MTKAQGRTPLKAAAPEGIHPPLDQEKVDGAMAQMRSDAQEDLLELLDLAGDVKAHQAFALIGKFAAASQVAIFKNIRQSSKANKIKDLPIRMNDGRIAKCDSLRDACQLLFGRSYDTMLREEESYDLLGEEAYEAASRLGLNRAALRAARALPPEQLKLVQSAITTSGTKAEVLSVIEDLASRIEQSEARIEELQAESEAKDKVLADKNHVADKLRQQLQRVKKLPPDEILQALLKEVSAGLHDARGALIGHFRQGLLALKQHHEANGGDSLAAMSGMVAQLQADLTAIREEFGLPEIAVDATPEWMKPEAEQSPEYRARMAAQRQEAQDFHERMAAAKGRQSTKGMTIKDHTPGQGGGASGE